MPSTLLIRSLTTCLLCYGVQAFEIGKTNTTNTVGFVQEDNQRDTISLLISCLATLGLCVYSAVHLNIPRKSEPAYATLFREFRWCIIGLFAPELILYTAWRQLASARELRSEVNEASKSTGGSTDVNDKVHGPAARDIYIANKNADFSCVDEDHVTKSKGLCLDSATWVLWHNGWLRN